MKKKKKNRDMITGTIIVFILIPLILVSIGLIGSAIFDFKTDNSPDYVECINRYQCW